MTVAFRLTGVSHSYSTRHVLRDVTLEAARGTTVAVIGSNGSGKTTLLRIAAGLRDPMQGKAALGDGCGVVEARRQGRIGYIPQHLGLVRGASALDNAALGGLRRQAAWRTLFGLPAPALAEAARIALRRVGLEDKARTQVRELSGGERQRVAVARSMVQRPDVLVADEPVASLDANRATETLALLRGLAQEGTTVLAAIHDLDAALAWADHVVALRDGSVVRQAPATDLTKEELLRVAY